MTSWTYSTNIVLYQGSSKIQCFYESTSSMNLSVHSLSHSFFSHLKDCTSCSYTKLLMVCFIEYYLSIFVSGLLSVCFFYCLIVCFFFYLSVTLFVKCFLCMDSLYKVPAPGPDRNMDPKSPLKFYSDSNQRV